MIDLLAVGFDHSMTAFGCVAVPSDWHPSDFRRIYRTTLTTGPALSDVERRAMLARDACRFVELACKRFGAPLGAVRVAIEGGLFMRGKAKTIRSQERLAGVVEHELFRGLGLRLELAEQTAIRSLFAGPSTGCGRGAGDACQELLRACNPELASWDEAELDAFGVSNWILADAGHAFISVATDRSEPATRRRRGKAA